MSQIRLWDLPTRLFHWLLVAAIAAAWATGEEGGSWMIWHGRIGLFVVGLVVFRICWGFLGSTYARFATFVRGPTAIATYLRGQWHGLGHNPLGALSVLGLLALTALQTGTGLFASNDDIAYTGYLQALVSSEWSERLTYLHHFVFDLLLILIGLHVAAILFYTHVRKDNLLTPMITGSKEIAQGQPASGGGMAALIVALTIASGSVWLIGSGALTPPPALVQHEHHDW